MTDVERVRLMGQVQGPDRPVMVDLSMLTRMADTITALEGRVRMDEERVRELEVDRFDLLKGVETLKKRVEELEVETERRCRELGLCAKVQEGLVKERDEFRERLERAKDFARTIVESGLDFDDEIWKLEVEEGGS